MKQSRNTDRLRDQHRGNVWSNFVWLAAVGGVLLIVGGPLGLLQPWNDRVGTGVQSELETADTGAPPDAVSLHTYFGLDETDSEAADPIAPPHELDGGWTYLDVGADCSAKPELSIRLRENNFAVFGYGLVAPTACGTHTPDDLDYTVIKGTHQDGHLVLTIVEKTGGHALYHFTGTVSSEGLVGNLAYSDGSFLADGLVFLPSVDGKI